MDLERVAAAAHEHVAGALAYAASLDADAVARVVNPLQASVVAWFGLLLAKAGAEAALDAFLLRVLAYADFTKLPSRVGLPGKSRGLEHLEAKDWTFLVLNQFIEAVFLHNLFRLMLSLPSGLEDATLRNTVGAIYATFVIDDFFYYWLHRFMHVQAVYGLVHKHHHRQACAREALVSSRPRTDPPPRRSVRWVRRVTAPALAPRRTSAPAAPH